MFDAVAEPVLQLQGIRMDFGGYTALRDVSFEVDEGTVHSLIGPNGAGKTTLLNIISGLLEPTAGSVVFEGDFIQGRKPYELARLGISRTFQHIRVSDEMTCLEEVELAVHARGEGTYLGGLARLPFRESRHEAMLKSLARRELSAVGLGDQHESQMARSLTLEGQRRLELARAVAASPRLLLLDEPTSGMGRAEALEVQRIILEQAEGGRTVLLVAHDIRLVMEISDRITVLNGGVVISDGSPSSVRNDPQVISAYLGSEVDDG